MSMANPGSLIGPTGTFLITWNTAALIGWSCTALIGQGTSQSSRLELDSMNFLYKGWLAWQKRSAGRQISSKAGGSARASL